jgi:osmoprotectant transport system permease protein
MSWTFRHLDDIAEALWQHLVLVGLSLSIGVAISLVLGIAAARHPRLYGVVIGAAGLLYTVPSLALFALLIPLMGLGTVPAITGLVAYSLLVLIRNIATGIREVPPEIIDAADGMGYDRLQRLVGIELPLALPVIVAGLRVALVTQIGVATIAAYINAGGLGTLIFAGINQRFPEKILVGAGLASLLAVAADLSLVQLERRLRAARAA